MKLPRPVWGWVDLLPSGRVRLRGPIDGERVTVGTYDTIEEAHGAALEMSRTLAGAPRGLSVGGWGERWLDRRELAGKHRSVDDSRGVWTRYVMGTDLADRLVREVRTKHVAQWLDALGERRKRDGKPLGHSTLRNALTTLSVVLRDAAIAGHLDANPCAGVVLPPVEARTEDEWTFLGAREIDALLEHRRIGNARQRLVYAAAIYTGLRSGELWGLRWPDVHADHVVVRYGNSAGGPTKSGKVRRVPLLPPARAAFAELRAIEIAREVPRIGGHVFIGKRGPHAEGYDAEWAGSWHRARYVKSKPVPVAERALVWRDGWREKCGVRGEVRFHDFRHTFASHLVMGTWGRAWRLEEVQQLLGHSSITTTERYAHLGPEGAARAVAEAEASWNVTPRVTRIERDRD